MWNWNHRFSCASITGTVALVALIGFNPLAHAQTSDQPGGQTGAQPSEQPPSTQQPSTEQPSTQQPSTEQPSTQQPSAQPAAPGGGKVQLPQVVVHGAKKPKAQPRPVARLVTPPPARVTPAPATVPPVSPAEIVAQRNNSFDQARSNLYTTIGTTSDTKSHETIEAHERTG